MCRIRVVELEDDAQEQAQQNRDRAGHDDVTDGAAHPQETRKRNQHNRTEMRPAHISVGIRGLVPTILSLRSDASSLSWVRNCWLIAFVAILGCWRPTVRHIQVIAARAPSLCCLFHSGPAH